MWQVTNVAGLTVVLLLLIPPAAADDKGTNKAPDVIYVADDDKEMNAAMEKARKSVEEFIKVFQTRQKGQSDFGVKVAIRDGKKVEHFWVQISKFDGKQFEGAISNDPTLVKTVKSGDPIKIPKEKIGDWMYVEKKKLVGGFTVRVLRNRLAPAERKALDESIPYKID
jgi:uncharacterized protein YegJ (DUF2314 family)